MFDFVVRYCCVLQEEEGWSRGQDCGSIAADTAGLALTPKHGESWVKEHQRFEANLGHMRTCLKL